MSTGARLKDEITANNKIVGLDDNLVTTFDGEALNAGSSTGHVYLPSLPNNAQLTSEEVRVFRGLGDHESLHSRLTPLDRWQEIGEYCLAANDKHGISMQVLNACEDVRIERLGMQSHPGIKRNLQSVLDKILEYQEHQTEPSTNPAFCIPAAITWDGRRDNGLHVELPPKLAQKREALRQAGEGFESLYEPDEFMPLLGRVAEFMLEQLGNSTLMNYMQGVPVETAKKENEQQCAGGSAPKGMQEALHKQKAMEAGMGCLTHNFATVGAPFFVDPDTVSFREVFPASHGIIIRNKVASLGRQFAISLKSTIQNRMDISRQQNYLDKRKLIDAYQGKEKVWSKKKNYDRGYNTAISMVIDQSGSMRHQIDHCMELVGSLAKAVRAVNVPLEITGFSEEITGHYPTNKYVRSGSLYINRFKRFDEPSCLKKLNNSRGYTEGYTPDTEALELAVGRIAKRPEKRKIIVILTDGNSETGKDYIHYNHTTYTVNDVFASHRASVLAQAKLNGVEVYAIMVGKGITRGAYSADKVLRVEDFKDLQSKMFQMFFNVIAGGGK